MEGKEKLLEPISLEQVRFRGNLPEIQRAVRLKQNKRAKRLPVSGQGIIEQNNPDDDPKAG